MDPFGSLATNYKRSCLLQWHNWTRPIQRCECNFFSLKTLVHYLLSKTTNYFRHTAPEITQNVLCMPQTYKVMKSRQSGCPLPNFLLAELSNLHYYLDRYTTCQSIAPRIGGWWTLDTWILWNFWFVQCIAVNRTGLVHSLVILISARMIFYSWQQEIRRAS